MARWTELIWSTQTVAPDDLVGAVGPGDSGAGHGRRREGPRLQRLRLDEISNPVLLSGDACLCVRNPRWLGRRA
jgi:hypothetical protein